MLKLWVRRDGGLASAARDTLNRHSPSLGCEWTPNQVRYSVNQTSLPYTELLSPLSPVREEPNHRRSYICSLGLLFGLQYQRGSR